jgi:hypothetical protein
VEPFKTPRSRIENEDFSPPPVMHLARVKLTSKLCAVTFSLHKVPGLSSLSSSETLDAVRQRSVGEIKAREINWFSSGDEKGYSTDG